MPRQPYPDMPFLMTAMSPYRASSSVSSKSASSVVNRRGNKSAAVMTAVPRSMVLRAFTDLLVPQGQISAAVPCDKASPATTLAAAFLVRGQVVRRPLSPVRL